MKNDSHLEENKVFFTELLTFYNMQTTQEERDNQNQEDILYFHFAEGTYTIKVRELKEKAMEELERIKSEPNILEDGE